MEESGYVLTPCGMPSKDANQTCAEWKSTGLGSRLTELDNGKKVAASDKLGQVVEVEARPDNINK